MGGAGLEGEGVGREATDDFVLDTSSWRCLLDTSLSFLGLL